MTLNEILTNELADEARDNSSSIGIVFELSMIGKKLELLEHKKLI